MIHRAKQYAFRALHPATKDRVGESLWQLTQPIQIESLVRDAEASLERVLGIDRLLDMILYRHQEKRFAEISAFTHRFKSSGTDHIPARRHHAEKLFAIEPMKGERGIAPILCGRARLVVKAMKLQFGMRFVPMI